MVFKTVMYVKLICIYIDSSSAYTCLLVAFHFLN